VARRKLAAGLLLAAGWLAGSALYRRRAARSAQRVDLYYADGSVVPLPEGSPGAERLLAIAHELLHEVG
jgi:hypothetical protein